MEISRAVSETYRAEVEGVGLPALGTDQASRRSLLLDSRDSFERSSPEAARDQLLALLQREDWPGTENATEAAAAVPQRGADPGGPAQRVVPADGLLTRLWRGLAALFTSDPSSDTGRSGRVAANSPARPPSDSAQADVRAVDLSRQITEQTLLYSLRMAKAQVEQGEDVGTRAARGAEEFSAEQMGSGAATRRVNAYVTEPEQKRRRFAWWQRPSSWLRLRRMMRRMHGRARRFHVRRHAFRRRR